MTKMKEIFRIIFRKNEEDVNMKAKWSLKKKLLLGGGIVSGLILGIFAYSKNHENDFEGNDIYGDEDCDDYTTDETEDLDEEIFVKEEVDAQA